MKVSQATGPSNVKRLTHDSCIERSRQRQRRVRTESRGLILEASRKEVVAERFRLLVHDLPNVKLRLQRDILSTYQPFEQAHFELEQIVAGLSGIDEKFVEEGVRNQIGELVNVGIFALADLLIWKSPLPLHQQIGLNAVTCLHRIASPFSTISLQSAHLKEVIAFGLTKARALSLSSASDTSKVEQEAVLSSACRTLAMFLAEESRCVDAAQDTTFCELLNALCYWRRSRAAHLLSLVCRSKPAVGILYHSNKVSVLSFAKQFAECRVDPQARSDELDTIYYGYMCLNELVPHAWDAIGAVVVAHLGTYCHARTYANYDVDIIEEQLHLLKEYRDLLMVHSTIVLPYLHSVFVERASLRDAVMDVLAAAPALVLQDETFLLQHIVPHYRQSGVRLLHLLNVMVSLCSEDHDRVQEMLEDDCLGWITVLSDGDLSEKETARLDDLMDCLGMNDKGIWYEGLSSPASYDDEGGVFFAF